MEKTRLGKTEMMVTRLGLGTIPIQRLSEEEAIAVIRRCLDLGINFIDTAKGYSTSEERIGKAIKGRRESVFLATKSHAHTCEDLERDIQSSLQKLGVDYIDLYQIHQVGDFKTLDAVLEPGGMVALLERYKSSGVIRHIGASSHQIDVAKAAVKTGRFETMMFPFNIIVSEAADELLPLTREYDVGFITMKPLAGGMLDNVAIAFKYLFQFPDIISIPGIQKIEEIEEIVQVLERPVAMTAADELEMQRMRNELGTRFCRRCDYCQPCEQGVPISWVMVFPTFVKRQPAEWFLSGMMADTMAKASNCTECGECEPRCPYHLPIREIISENRKLFEELKGSYRK